jgi:hypothetical protein
MILILIFAEALALYGLIGECPWAAPFILATLLSAAAWTPCTKCTSTMLVASGFLGIMSCS